MHERRCNGVHVWRVKPAVTQIGGQQKWVCGAQTQKTCGHVPLSSDGWNAAAVGPAPELHQKHPEHDTTSGGFTLKSTSETMKTRHVEDGEASEEPQAV